jgi:hypothetical protein
MAGKNTSNAANAPAWKLRAVTPSDATVIQTTRSLYVGVAGDLRVRDADGNTVTVKNAPVGYHPLQVDMVLSTGTAATDILALY